MSLWCVLGASDHPLPVRCARAIGPQRWLRHVTFSVSPMRLRGALDLVLVRVDGEEVARWIAVERLITDAAEAARLTAEHDAFEAARESLPPADTIAPEPLYRIAL